MFAIIQVMWVSYQLPDAARNPVRHPGHFPSPVQVSQCLRPSHHLCLGNSVLALQAAYRDHSVFAPLSALTRYLPFVVGAWIPRVQRDT